jgi:processive 1,2-diacylglycerol beta-glucosyltransferase
LKPATAQVLPARLNSTPGIMAKRVLFLYISPSSGHQHASDAIREALSILEPNWETFGIDSFTYAYPKIGKLIARAYLEVLRRTPTLWNYVYDNPDVETATREIREVLNLLSASKMQTLIEKHSPEAIVCTQAAPCSVFAAEKRRGALSIPLIAVVTDFAIHSYWVYKEVDLYCVASEEARKDLARYGIDASKIVVTGIPISPQFLKHRRQESVRARLGLDVRRPTVLVMGGSQGMGPLQETIDRLSELPIQCIVATGLNRELYRLLLKSHGRNRRMRFFGYTRQIPLLMEASDLFISKPGGLSSSEALAKGLPMILTNPIPGQEERNARYLERMGVADQADSPEEIAAKVSDLLQNPLRRNRMIERTREIARPYASIEIARWICRLVSAGKKEQPSSLSIASRASWAPRKEYDKIPSA